jgi:hypothetical protein
VVVAARIVVEARIVVVEPHIAGVEPNVADLIQGDGAERRFSLIVAPSALAL